MRPPISARSLRTVLPAGLLFLIVALFVSPIGLPGGLDAPSSIRLSVAAVIIAGAICTLHIAAGSWPSTRVDWVVALYAGTLAIAVAFAPDRAQAVRASVVDVAAIGLLYSGVIVGRHGRTAGGLVLVLVTGAAIVELMAFAYHLDFGLAKRPTLYPIPEGWSGYPELGGLAVLQMGLLFGALIAAERFSEGLAVGVFMLVGAGEILALYSRTAWLAMMVMAPCAMLWPFKHRRWVLGMGVVFAGVVAILIYTVPMFSALTRTALGREYATPGIDIANSESRFQTWSETLVIARGSPLHGVGPGHLHEALAARHPPDWHDMGRTTHAHDLFLQRLAELGLPGGISFTVLWALLLWIAWQSARRTRDAVGIGLFLALVGATASNLTDYVPGELAGARVYLLTWVLFGVALARSRPVLRV